MTFIGLSLMLAAQGFLYDASADCMGIDLLILTFLPEIEKCFSRLFTINYNPCGMYGQLLFYSFFSKIHFISVSQDLKKEVEEYIHNILILTIKMDL